MGRAWRLGAGAFSTAAVAGTLIALPASAAAAPGDVIVADYNSNSNVAGKLWRIDGATGARTPVPLSTPIADPIDVTFAADGKLIVADLRGAAGGAVVQVDPATGAVTRLASGAPLVDPTGVAVAPDGQIYVADTGGSATGAIFRIDPATGAVATVAELEHPNGITVAPSRELLVTDQIGPAGVDALLGVDPINGALTIIAHGLPFGSIRDVARAPSGYLFVVDAAAAAPLSVPAVFVVDRATHRVTVAADGPPLSQPSGLALETSGQIIVGDPFGTGNARGRAFRVNPASGSIVSIASGSDLFDPVGLAIEPPTCRGRPATIVGSSAGEKITGSTYPDVIATLGGNDKAKGRQGNDLICGGAGRDKLVGGPGRDRLFGQAGRDTLRGGGGRDLLRGGKGRDKLVR